VLGRTLEQASAVARPDQDSYGELRSSYFPPPLSDHRMSDRPLSLQKKPVAFLFVYQREPSELPTASRRRTGWASRLSPSGPCSSAYKGRMRQCIRMPRMSIRLVRRSAACATKADLGVVGAPDTIRTCDLCLRRANVYAPIPGTTHLINRKNGVLQAPGQPRHSVPPYSALRCLAKLRYGSFMTSTEIEGLGQNLAEPQSDSTTAIRPSGATAICPLLVA
jgi:hypothetical protein